MPRKTSAAKKQRIHKKRRRNFLLKRYILLAIIALALLGTGYFIYQKARFYYAIIFENDRYNELTNTEFETKRIKKILTEYNGQTFGIDISHYQRKEDIKWDSLSLAAETIPISFAVFRATMGNRHADDNFDHYWKKAKKHGLIRGAYHFYRADEDPIFQANNYLENVQLERGDLPPILDIEKIPRKKSKEQLIKDLKIWCKIMEETYGKKPIIYTFYHYYKDYLREDFKDYPLWLANYNDVLEPSPEDEWQFWQFTEKGIVKGINTKVDVDIYNGSLYSLKNMTLED